LAVSELDVPPPLPSGGPPPRLPTPPPIESRQLAARVAGITYRDDVAAELFSAIGPHVRRAALFSVRQNVCTGWLTMGAGLSSSALAGLVISLDQPSVLAEAAEANLYVGRMAKGEINDELTRRFGPPPPACVIAAAVRLYQHLAAILLIDAEDEQRQRAAFLPVTEAVDNMTSALVSIILSRKHLEGRE
jgi:hypothetical protein